MNLNFLKQLHPRSIIAGCIAYSLLLLLALYSATSGCDKIPVIKNPLKLEKSIPDDIWFLPDGSLVAVGSSDHRVWIKKWFTGNWSPASSNSLDFAAKLSITPQYSLRKTSTASATQYVAYALAPSSKILAWAWEGRLHLQKLDGSEIQPPIPLKNNQGVLGLSFISDSAVGVLYSNGEFLVSDWSPGPHSGIGSVFLNTATLWTQGSKIAISYLDTGEAWIADYPHPMQFLPARCQCIGSTTVSLSSTGEVAFGTSDSVIVFPASGKGKPPSIGLGKGPIGAMNFYDKGRVIVGGAFSGLYLVARDSEPIKLTDIANNINLIAIQKNVIAFSGADGIYIATIGTKAEFSSFSATIWKWLLAFISIAGFTLALLRDRKASPT